MAKLFNLARMTTATTGTGTITLGAAVSGFLTFAQAGVVNGDVVSYGIVDGTNSEVGTGLYTSSGTTLTRNVLKSTNSDAAISLSGNAQVFITALKEQIGNLQENNSWLGNQTLAAGKELNWATGPKIRESGSNLFFESSSAGYTFDTSIFTTETWLGNIPLSQAMLPRVRVVATSNINISTGLVNGGTIDGITVATSDFVLLSAQTTPAQNGIYTVVGSGAASRTTGLAAYDTLAGGIVTVMEGTKEAETIWYCTSNKGGTIDTTNLTYLRARPLAATPSFSATNASNQTITDGTFTQVQFDTENSDVGSYFSGNNWTPPKGTVLLLGAILVGGSWAVGGTVAFSIGGVQITGGAQTTSVATVNGSVMLTANGSQSFTMVAYCDVTSGNGTLNGGGNLSFAGVWLGP